jgi:hypothetical protein
MLRGRTISVRNGDEVVQGLAAGLSAGGRLQIDTAGGRREIVAGDVTVISALPRAEDAG